MSLVEKRIAFTACVGKLLVYAEASGYRVLLCEALRTPMQSEWNATHCSAKESGFRCEKGVKDPIHELHQFRPIGIRGSLHQAGLAIDTLIMRQKQDGDWAIDEAEGNYRVLANYWKSLDPLARAGIDFSSPDMGHFSFEHEGRR